MTKEDLLKRVKTDIDLMINGNEFDVRHLFGMTAWLTFYILRLLVKRFFH